MTLDSGNVWFVVSVMYEGEHVPGDGQDNIWEESLLLVAAPDSDAAHQIAEKIGRKREHGYAVDGGLINWRLRFVDRVCAVDGDLDHGSEIFSRFLKATEVESIVGAKF